jgi:hypothetical protein
MTTPPPAAPAGWYPNPSGEPGQRYFDGIHWGDVRPATGDQPPSAVLDQAIVKALTSGGRLEYRSEFDAVLVYGQPVNHVLHAILSIGTGGFWLPVWWYLSSKSRRNMRREVLAVDPDGKLRFTAGP